MEALEAGASTLLLDEDTSATNFMIRDRRMQALVPKEGEPITPFVDRVRALWEERGVSSVIVLGGSGDYLNVADRVIAMKEYRPLDVSSEALRVAADFPTGRQSESPAPLGPVPIRVPDPSSVDPSRGRREAVIKVHDRNRLALGKELIDLTAVSQLASEAQTRAIGRALVLAHRNFIDDNTSVGEILVLISGMIEEGGLDVLDERLVGDLAMFRPLEFAAALNRLRTLRVSRDRSSDGL
jgi:predicted ABC-class ATPase